MKIKKELDVIQIIKNQRLLITQMYGLLSMNQKILTKRISEKVLSDSSSSESEHTEG